MQNAQVIPVAPVAMTQHRRAVRAPVRTEIIKVTQRSTLCPGIFEAEAVAPLFSTLIFPPLTVNRLLCYFGGEAAVP